MSLSLKNDLIKLVGAVFLVVFKLICCPIVDLK
jgi:hypothetical protein